MLLSYCAKVDYHTTSLFHMPSFVLESDRHKSGSFLFLPMTTDEIRDLIQRGELWRFYKSKEWIRLKTKILKANHYECAECRRHGIITRYDTDSEGHVRLLSTVHHVCHVRDHPELALSRYYKDYETGEMKPNLVPVCKACHNSVCHPEKAMKRKKEGFTNTERW